MKKSKSEQEGRRHQADPKYQKKKLRLAVGRQQLESANLRNMDKSDDNGLCDYKELDDTDTVHTGACFLWRIWARWRMMVQV